jgi:hypothetical protein
MQSTVTKNNIGYAGVLDTVSRLIKRGWLATPLGECSPDADIFAGTQDQRRQVSIQVKTASKGQNGWPMKARCEVLESASFFYCLIDPNDVTYMFGPSLCWSILIE